MALPTLRQLVVHNSEDEVIVEVIAMIARSMNLWGPNRRMSGEMIAEFAASLVSDFPHENLADVNVFMKKAAVGTYDGGEFYASLDPARLGGWWRKYLADKAEALEQVSRKRGRGIVASATQQLAEIGVSTSALHKAMSEVDKYENRSKRDDNLRRTIPMMSDDDLRAAYKKHKDAWARRIILTAAASRGLLGEEIRVQRQQEEAQEQEQYKKWEAESAAAANELDELEKSINDPHNAG